MDGGGDESIARVSGVMLVLEVEEGGRGVRGNSSRGASHLGWCKGDARVGKGSIERVYICRFKVLLG